MRLHWRISILRLIIIAATWLELLQANEESSVLTSKFQALKSDVYVVSNFLPQSLAMKWRDELKRIWNESSFTESVGGDDSCPDEDTHWLYTTNNNGQIEANNNAKVRSLKNIHERNSTAQKMRLVPHFSYSKWELAPHHKLVQEVREVFISPKMVDRVQNLLNVKLQAELSDLFVTYYGPGDFLSPHDDVAAGTWAFVVSLLDGETPWQESFGGGLRFECPSEHLIHFADRKVEWCNFLYPTFNSAVFFETRVRGDLPGPGPMHEVLPVTATTTSAHRFSITGWYMDTTDEFPRDYLVERNKMRGF